MSDLERKNRRPPPNGNSFRDFELRPLGDYYAMIRERWILGFSCAVLAGGLAGYFLLKQPTVYQSEASLLVERHGERVVDIQQVVDTELDGGMWRVLLENHLKELMSRSFLNYVLESFTEEERQQIVAPYLPEDESGPEPHLGGIVRNVEVDNIANSFILRVRARHGDPEVAALIADRYVIRYVDFIRDRRRGGNEAAITFLTEQAEELRRVLEEAEQELHHYRQTHNLVSAEENQGLIAQRLRDINTSLTVAQVERIDLEGRLQQVESFHEDERDLLELGDITSLGSTAQVAVDLDQLRQEKEVMSERYLERHPRMIENQRAIEAAERLIRSNIERSTGGLRSRLHNAREKEEALLRELQEVERESLRMDRLAIQYTVLQRAAAGARNTHALILDRLNEAAITSQLNVSNIRIVDRAEANYRPVEPNILKVAVLVVFLGGFFFLGAPIGLAVLDKKVKGAADVEVSLGQKLIGEISSVRKISQKERAHVVERDLDDQASEGFRGLFSQLQLSSGHAFPKTLMATSTLPGEGKSFLVSNLSCCFAGHGSRTLMIDLDLRRPSLHRSYDRGNEAGVLQWLKVDAALDGDLLKNEALGIEQIGPNLFLLRAGGQTKKATEAINHPRVSALLAALKARFDILMIDTPPLGIFPDALAVARQADESLYVVRFGAVNREQVRNFLGRLSETQATLLGVVMNGMPIGGQTSHYYSGYGGGNRKYAKYYARSR